MEKLRFISPYPEYNPNTREVAERGCSSLARKGVRFKKGGGGIQKKMSKYEKSQYHGSKRIRMRGYHRERIKSAGPCGWSFHDFGWKNERADGQPSHRGKDHKETLHRAKTTKGGGFQLNVLCESGHTGLMERGVKLPLVLGNLWEKVGAGFVKRNKEISEGNLFIAIDRIASLQ